MVAINLNCHEHRSEFKIGRYINNFNWLFFDRILRVFLALSVSIWVARYLGPRDFGILNYALAFIAFFSWASHLGLQQIVVRELTKTPDEVDRILGAAFFMKLIGAVISVLLIAVAISAIKPEDGLIKLVVFLASLIYVFQAFDVTSFFFEAKVLSKNTAIARSVSVMVSSALKIYLILGGYSVVWFALANVLDIFVAGALLLFLFTHLGNSVRRWRFDINFARELIGYSWPVMIGSFLVTIHLKIDQIMIESYLSLDQLGIYSVAVRLSEAWYFIPAIIGSTVFPYFVSLRESDSKLYKYRLVQAYCGMFWLAITVALVVQIFGEPGIMLLFGQDYVGSSGALALNIWAGVFVAQSYIKMIWDVSENLQVYRIAINSTAIVVNIAGNLLLIPMYGISGAAMATLISRAFNNWVTPLMFKATRENTLISIRSISPLYVLKQRELLK